MSARPLEDLRSGALRQAMQRHAAGELDAARALYRQLLEQDAQHADALHLLGVLEAHSGHHEQAESLIRRAIEVKPDEAMFHNNLGNVCIERQRLDEAQAAYLRSIELAPGRLDALNNLGVLLSRRQQPDEAEKLLLEVVRQAPDFSDARQNLAHHYLRQGRVADAVQQCFDGLVTAPRSSALRRILGLAYASLGRNDKAAEVYREWLRAEPEHPVPAFHLQALGGDPPPDRAPDAYVQRVFDQFAGSFDAKLADLSYRAPALVAESVARHLGAAAHRLDVLDAGCGTGLCGPLLAPWARHLAGVDLSAGMLQKAVARRCYDELVQGELVACLKARRDAFDLVVAADTLVYFGRLEAFAAAARGALRDGGLLVFTVEAHADEPGAPAYRLQGHGRYSHRRRYLDEVLRGAGLSPVEMQAVVPRTEAGEPVDGCLVAARASRSN